MFPCSSHSVTANKDLWGGGTQERFPSYLQRAFGVSNECCWAEDGWDGNKSVPGGRVCSEGLMER